jgi:chemotaxis protein histidine kinase CheA
VSAFRSLHTIKGTCSFLGLRRLERVRARRRIAARRAALGQAPLVARDRRRAARDRRHRARDPGRDRIAPRSSQRRRARARGDDDALLRASPRAAPRCVQPRAL